MTRDRTTECINKRGEGRLVRLQITVSGDVQGVGYRYFAQMKAIQYNITGWVKNSSNGVVEIAANGETEDMDAYIEELRNGNPFSKVTNISCKPLADTEPFHSFKIKY